MAFADPKKNIEHLMIGEDMKVVDVGSGGGAYTFVAAGIAESGKVYAIDVQKDLLSKLRAEAAKRHLHNIETVWADIEELGGTKLMDGIADRAIISNLLFQIEHKEGAAKEVARLVRPKGRLMVIDWTDSFGGLGPVPNDVFSASKARALFERAGFQMLKEFDAGDHHYGIIFEKL
jgi:ubiquinone/menaquinone biosynthesis C-methylase UbiE